MLASAFFALILTGATALGVWTVRSTMLEELRGQILDELRLLTLIDEEEGRAELIETVESLASRRVPHQRVVGAFTPQGTPLAGDLATLPGFPAWGTLTQSVGDPPKPIAFQVRVMRLDDAVLVLGRSQTLILRTQAVLARNAVVSVLVIVAAVLVLGYWSSKVVSRQLARMSSALERFAEGRSDTRIAMRGSNDQITFVADQIDAQLGRLGALMETMRRSGIAIAHDLRTPLARASLFLQETVRDTDLPADARERLEAAIGELEALSGTFDTIMRISQIEASNDTSAFTRVDLPALAQEICETYAPVFEDGGLELECRADAPVTVECDRRMIGQALVNLAENVIRHCPPGTRALLATRREEGFGVIELVDDGPGVPDDALETLFDAFYQGDPSRRSGGTGLGMALVRTIAEHHGGSVHALSARPGLRVILRLPFHDGTHA